VINNWCGVYIYLAETALRFTGEVVAAVGIVIIDGGGAGRRRVLVRVAEALVPAAEVFEVLAARCLPLSVAVEVVVAVVSVYRQQLE
jgi:hypothetical protein